MVQIINKINMYATYLLSIGRELRCWRRTGMLKRQVVEEADELLCLWEGLVLPVLSNLLRWDNIAIGVGDFDVRQ